MALLPLSIVSNPPVVSEEPTAAVVNDESARRQNIAARMAKLGGIKLGGPPMFNSRQASGSTDRGLQSPTEMPQTPLSPMGDGPLSPTSPVMSRSPGLEDAVCTAWSLSAIFMDHLRLFDLVSRRHHRRRPCALNMRNETVESSAPDTGPGYRKVIPYPGKLFLFHRASLAARPWCVNHHTSARADAILRRDRRNP